MAEPKSGAAANAATEPDPKKDPNAFITMRHSGIDGEARATRLAYEAVYKDKGWTEVKDSASFDPQAAPGDLSPAS